MSLLVIVASSIALSTIIGAALGIAFKSIPHKYNDMILGGASGLMLGAAVQGLIVPAAFMPGKASFLLAAIGLFGGASLVSLIDRLSPHLHAQAGGEMGCASHAAATEKVLLFVAAIAIHKLPEGLAAGVGFGAGNAADTAAVAFSISLQNIPEAVVIVSPLLSVGIPVRRTMLISVAVSAIGVVGVLVGYGLIMLPAVQMILPFFLAFAGGAMLYVIGGEMIPETHSHGYEKMATFSLLAGLMIFLAIQKVTAL